MRLPLNSKAIMIMTLICFVWGLQQVAIKAAEKEVSLTLQIAMRSGLAALVIYVYAKIKGEKFSMGKITLFAGVCAGVLFALEFFFLSEGLRYSSASHMAVLLYTAPLYSAVGLHIFSAEEKLTARQWFGVMIAFFGLVVSMINTVAHAGFDSINYGDLCGLLAGLAWGCTTVVIRTTPLSVCSAKQTLLYQLSGAFIILMTISLFNDGYHFKPGTVAYGSLIFQTLIVSVISYLVWFSLLRNYQVASLSMLTFMTPFFGILSGIIILHEKVQANFIAGTVLLIIGLLFITVKTHQQHSKNKSVE